MRIGNDYTATSQLTDDAGLGQTAIWSQITGAGKPQDNATKNTIYRQPSPPTGTFVDGDLWFDTDADLLYRWDSASSSWVYIGSYGARLGTNLKDSTGTVRGDADFAASFNPITSSNVSTFIANAAIQAAQIGTAQIQNAHLDRASVNKIQIVEADIVDAAITSAKIADAAITNAKLDRASANKIQIDTADIVDAAIKTAKIADLNVTELKIANGAVTNYTAASDTSGALITFVDCVGTYTDVLQVSITIASSSSLVILYGAIDTSLDSTFPDSELVIKNPAGSIIGSGGPVGRSHPQIWIVAVDSSPVAGLATYTLSMCVNNGGTFAKPPCWLYAVEYKK